MTAQTAPVFVNGGPLTSVHIIASSGCRKAVNPFQPIDVIWSHFKAFRATQV